MNRIEVAELSLATLDGLDVDALALLVGEERPLQGLAGLVDWRLAGALTRALAGGLYAAAPGEALLLPTAGRLPTARVVVLGQAPGADQPGFAATVRRLGEVVARAGAACFAAAALPMAGLTGAEACRAWVAMAAVVPGDRLVLLGEPRTLAADLVAARIASRVEVELVPFSAPATMVR